MSVFAEVSAAPPIEVFQLSRDFQVGFQHSRDFQVGFQLSRDF